MTDVLVHQAHDDLPARLDFVGAVVDVGDPVERLLRWRDVVAYRGEQDDRDLDLPQVERADRCVVSAPRPQLVADEEILRDPLDLLAIHQEVAAPPTLEFEKARRLGVDVGEEPVVLVPEGIRRIQVLEVLHQVRAVELAATDIGGQRREPGASQQTAGVAHGVVALALTPRAAPVGHRRTDDHDGAGVVGTGSGKHHGGPAGLAVAYDGGLRRVRMELTHALHELSLGFAYVEQRLSRYRIPEENDEIHRVAFPQCHADLGIVLEAANPRTVATARVDDHVRAPGGVDCQSAGGTIRSKA
jgi:hypothetical protein